MFLNQIVKNLVFMKILMLQKAAVPFHSDNGLLLLLTPFKEQPLLMKNKNGDVLTTGELDNDSVIVIIASALPNWLLKGKLITVLI